MTDGKEDQITAAAVNEVYEWEVLVSRGPGPEELGPCGTSRFQAIAVAQVTGQLRDLPAGTRARARIRRRLFTFAVPPREEPTREILTAELGADGIVIWTQVPPPSPPAD
ncbi:hypothetical protein [Bailinhaonella thermotolerans]|uniref:Uncharacterized protein n=1 Tax=Bailinhaonella thermotolerans TaxID=1070861 RepID=A0A3A4AZK0_9ACTN|nr:hypothetical protein [Bailinhaonella thermotolerans]RJL33088.1 hypothetical protein D5H75_09510 [Bailinhaonella thermotolerans]